ncbi:UDP-2,4-diacetamido-2,4,6-trideoxy-beta-L-altropyranose hydrolase [Acetobacterium malicum]|uniref:UDP-2,4-diacetamido-2,4, 6-trideoxy-beta-L-altropyranose hydrolase n=1 Tax=Acetobacterium malicum TaxID=52692 RepID=UPI003593B1A1
MAKECLKIKVAILAEGNPEIGLGHVSRCITLAKEFRRKGIDVFFISNFPEGIQLISKNSFKIYSYSKKESLEKTEELFDIISQNKVTLLIIDSYTVTREYFEKIRTGFAGKIGYIDDLNKFTYPVDILIHGSLLNQIYNYQKKMKNAIILAGLEYNLLRDEFRDVPLKVIKKRVQEIMITAGGADLKNMTEEVIGFFLKNQLLDQYQLNVVIGSAFRNKDRIIELSKKNKNIFVFDNPSAISEIMIRSDIAITAAGVTLYELFATGTPLLALITASNQRIFVEELEKREYLINAGILEEWNDKKFLVCLESLVNDHDRRMQMSLHTQKILDGKGATRVVDEILINLHAQGGNL